MKRNLLLLLVLFVISAFSVNAQNMLSANIANSDGNYVDLWADNHKSQTDPAEAFADFALDPNNAGNNTLHLTNTGSTAQAKINSKVTFNMQAGKKYILKLDRYVVTGVGDKIGINGTLVAQRFSGNPNYDSNLNNTWVSVQMTYTPTADITSGFLCIQLSPGEAEVYYDNFSLEEDITNDINSIGTTSKIYNVGNVLYFNTIEKNYQIYSLTGDLMQSGQVENQVEVSLKSGIYIVKAGATTVKIKL